MLEAYVYKITNNVTKQFYYGSRTENIRKNRKPEEDLWKFYFTSSKIVKQMIEEYGIDSFDHEIVFKDINYENCFWKEQQLIFESKDNPLRLNKAYVNPTTGKKVLTSFNESEIERKNRISKMSKSKKGKFNSNGHFGLKHSEETKQKMREAQLKLNYSHSEETKQKMRRKKSQDHIEKISNTLKGKPWSEARRQSYLNKKGKQHV
jgi:hypothetical protein